MNGHQIVRLLITNKLQNVKLQNLCVRNVYLLFINTLGLILMVGLNKHNHVEDYLLQIKNKINFYEK